MMRVAVLMGGTSSERDVSLVTGKGCAVGLREAGFEVIEVDVNRHVAQRLVELAPDVCFNALHGGIGEDGSIQGLLNILGIPYTHSGVAASSIAMDKNRSRHVAQQLGLAVPRGRAITREEFRSTAPVSPFVLKPICGGSSINTFVVKDVLAMPADFGTWPFDGEALIEDLVVGEDLTVTVLGQRPLTVTLITTEEPFYNYHAKYAHGASVHVLPAPIPLDKFDLCMALALSMHKGLGCRGISRSDFILSKETGAPVFLEINTQPGMTPTSLSPEQAKHVGIEFPELMRRLVEAATTD